MEENALKEQLITLDSNNSPSRNEYEYVMHNNKKIYKDDIGYFWNNNNKKQYITDEETLQFVRKWTQDGHLYSNSAIEYYIKAYEFSLWVNQNLGHITQKDAVDSEGNEITDFAINTGESKIFKLGGESYVSSESTYGLEFLEYFWGQYQ